jgi:hypothetical protein
LVFNFLVGCILATQFVAAHTRIYVCVRAVAIHN